MSFDSVRVFGKLLSEKDEVHEILESSKELLQPNNKFEEMDKMSHAKTWLQYIVKAIEEDLAKTAIKCANTYCCQVKVSTGKSRTNNNRDILGHKKWLCEVCMVAYDRRQFCEFCSQIYLENTGEMSALDGKEWAQCEGLKECGRWAHVECLERKHNKTRDEVVAIDFKYNCCGCAGKLSGKRKVKR